MLSHVALCESLLHAGLARGRIDVAALGQVVGAPTLDAITWAFGQLPDELGSRDVVWVSSEEESVAYVRIGPNEWSRTGGYADLRRVGLALGVLAAASRQLRGVDEETLGELLTALAYRQAGQKLPSDFAGRLATAFAFEKKELVAAAKHTPNLYERLLALAQQPFASVLKTRPLLDDRALGLWRELLNMLSALSADGRPLAVWVGPLWVADLVSPYTREVQPLLERWAREHANLPRLADAIAKGDADATYMCANLFHDQAVLAEREEADVGVGIYTIADPNGVRLAKVCDTSALDLAMVDDRLDVREIEVPAPIVVMLNGADPDVSYAFTRLLCDVSAEFRAVNVCAEGMRGSEPVASSPMLRTERGAVIVAAPAPGVPTVRPLGLPDVAYLKLFPAAWDGEHDAVVESHRLGQDAIGEALWRGDVFALAQRFWLGDTLDDRRAHIADALGLWRELLGVRDEAPVPEPERPTEKPTLKPGSLRFRA